VSYNNNVYKFKVGDLVERITWDAQARKMGVVIALGSDLKTHTSGDALIQVCWQDAYGSFWINPDKLKLLAKGKRNV